MVEDRLAERRNAWPENQAKILEIEKHIEAEAKRRFEKYVAPFAKREGLPPGVSDPFVVARHDNGVSAVVHDQSKISAVREALDTVADNPGNRSIYDRAMEPVPWPTVQQPATTESREKTSVSE